MRKLLPALMMFASLALCQTQTFTYTYSGLPLPIFPDDWNTWSVTSVLVPKSISVTKVTVSVQAQYGGVGDLNVFLWSPSGTRTKLLERNCGALQNIDTSFDDSASAMYHDVCPTEPGRGPFRSNEPLANSQGENAFGYWRLGIENNGSSHTGVLTGFSITITGQVLGPPVIGPNTIVSTSSFENGLLAPGDQITILGVNLGPTNGVRADATQPLPTTLSQTTVTFDGAAAPLYYVSDGFVVAQVPLGLAPRSTSRVQVRSAAGTSAPVVLPVATTKPGIFTYEAGGRGQAKAVNEGGSLNGDGSITGSDKPAAPRSIISIYATGLGPVEPAIPQGAPAPANSLSKLTLPITATIDGRTATVAWAGAAPGQVGMYQVNLAIPDLTPSGTARVVLSVDGNNSQNGVTIQIR